MSGRPHKVLFAVFVAAAVGIVWVFFGEPQGQRVSGKPLGYWLDEINAGGARSNAAVAAFVQAGEQAARVLTNELCFVPAGRNRLIALKAQLPWAVASRMPSPRPINWARRVAAANALGLIGPDGKLAVPALLAAVTATEPIELSLAGQNGGMMVGQQWDHNLRAVALTALTQIDSENIEALMTAAKSAAEWEGLNSAAQGVMAPVRDAAMRMLANAREPDIKTVRSILEIVREQETEISRRDLSAFVSRTSPPRSLVTLEQIYSETNVLRCLASSSARDRAAAAFELGDAERAGAPRTKAATLVVSEQGIAALVEALKDSEVKVRLNAAETWVKLGSKEGKAEVEAALPGLLENTNLFVRLRAVDLARVRMRGSAATEKLEQMKEDEVGMVRVRAHEAAVGDLEK
jgi:HEAT repeat protein